MSIGGIILNYCTCDDMTSKTLSDERLTGEPRQQKATTAMGVRSGAAIAGANRNVSMKKQTQMLCIAVAYMRRHDVEDAIGRQHDEQVRVLVALGDVGGLRSAQKERERK